MHVQDVGDSPDRRYRLEPVVSLTIEYSHLARQALQTEALQTGGFGEQVEGGMHEADPCAIVRPVHECDMAQQCSVLASDASEEEVECFAVLEIKVPGIQVRGCFLMGTATD